MATLDDKLLGEKTHYYCSDSEEERDDEVGEDRTKGSRSKKCGLTRSESTPPGKEWNGCSTNTGPKGVVSDFNEYRELRARHQVEMERKQMDQMRKMQISVRTAEEEDLDRQMKELESDSDDFLKKYMKKKMADIEAKSKPTKLFGQVCRLKSSCDFYDHVQHEDPNTYVVVHVFTNKMQVCITMNKIMEKLAKRHVYTKFIAVDVATVNLSQLFEEKGCPALLVYKNSILLGNFVRVTNSVASDFELQDIEDFLIEHGFLQDPKTIVCPGGSKSGNKFKDGIITKFDGDEDDD